MEQPQNLTYEPLEVSAALTSDEEESGQGRKGLIEMKLVSETDTGRGCGILELDLQLDKTRHDDLDKVLLIQGTGEIEASQVDAEATHSIGSAPGWVVDIHPRSSGSKTEFQFQLQLEVWREIKAEFQCAVYLSHRRGEREKEWR